MTTDTVSGAVSPAPAARLLIRRAMQAVLATMLDGWPYASLVLAASDWAGAPLLLLSDLAEHSRNLKRAPRASLLFSATEGLADPLTGARLTVLGETTESTDPRLYRRYLARHPSARRYAGFKDFRLYRLAPQRAHLVAGFGRIEWIEAGALLAPAAAAATLADAEPDILAEVERDHAAALDRYARTRLGLAGAGWRLVGIDPDGGDLRHDAATARLDFVAPAPDAEGVRRELLRLVAPA